MNEEDPDTAVVAYLKFVFQDEDAKSSDRIDAAAVLLANISRWIRPVTPATDPYRVAREEIRNALRKIVLDGRTAVADAIRAAKLVLL